MKDENRWISPTDAHTLARLEHNLHANRDRTVLAMPADAVQWGRPSRGEGRLNPLARRAVKVHFGEYLKAARGLAETPEARCSNHTLATLEARIAALEAAFDSLLATTKGIA
jgi:hypothetical protein